MNIDVNLAGLGLMNAGAESIRSGLMKGVEDACELVKKAAMENLKGDARGKHLMSSIHTEVQAGGDTVTGQIGVGAATGIDGEAGENFGIYVHEGTGIYSRTGMGRKEVPWFYEAPDKETGEMTGHRTSGMEANPFLENAYNSESGKVSEIIAQAVAEAIARGAG